MLQLGRFSARGTGAIVVCGPLGMCCVEPDLADSAADVVWGHADIGQWLSQMVHFGRSIVFFDLSGVQPFLTVLGGAWVRGLGGGSWAVADAGGLYRRFLRLRFGRVVGGGGRGSDGCCLGEDWSGLR